MTVAELMALADQAGTIEGRANVYKSHTHYGNLRAWECEPLTFAPAWSSFLSLPTSLDERLYVLLEDLVIYQDAREISPQKISAIGKSLSRYALGDISCFIHKYVLMDSFSLKLVVKDLTNLPKMVEQRKTYLRMNILSKPILATQAKPIASFTAPTNQHPLFAAIRGTNE